MISTRGHTAAASKTSISERQSLLGLGSKAKQIVENVLTTFTENLQQTQRLQYSRQYNLSTVYNILSEAKYTGDLFTFNSRFFIPEVDEKITERKEKNSNISIKL